MRWHYDPKSGRNVKGINLPDALYHAGEHSTLAAFRVVRKRPLSTLIPSPSDQAHEHGHQECADAPHNVCVHKKRIELWLSDDV